MINQETYFEEKTEQYLKRELPEEQVNALWIEFLEKPERLEQFKTEVNLIEILNPGYLTHQKRMCINE